MTAEANGAADRLVAALRAGGVRDAAVLARIAATPRELFVPPIFRARAWDDTALPVACGQTISQPLVVAMMTEALALDDRCKVLEIGAGTGYQTAVMAPLCRRVYSIERHAPLLRDAEARLAALRIYNVQLRSGDGSLGWPEQAPFDRILLTCAAERRVPEPLLAQLRPGGVMVAPIAASPVEQRLWRITRREDGTFNYADLGGVRFVPLVEEGDAERRS